MGTFMAHPGAWPITNMQAATARCILCRTMHVGYNEHEEAFSLVQTWLQLMAVFLCVLCI